MIRLSAEPIDPPALLAAFLAGLEEAGGVVSFTGVARRDGEVEALELEAYPGFTEPVIEAQVRAAAERFGLIGVTIVHRIGLVRPGEPVVFVATAARHRRAAFEGCDFLMDWLKSRAPFWKKEHRPDGARWIEPAPGDLTDLTRWETA